MRRGHGRANLRLLSVFAHGSLAFDLPRPAPGAESVRDDKVSRAKRIQCNLLAKRTMARTEEVRDLCHEILRLYGNPEAGSNEELHLDGSKKIAAWIDAE